MASFSSLLVFLSAALTLVCVITAAPAAAPSPVGPSNFTAILEKGGQYTSFIRLLRSTQVGNQIQSQLNNSFNGLTVFAPTDNAFNNLKPGTLNGLSSQDQVNLVLSHVLPRYYSLDTFETASNPVVTQASGPAGVYTVNISSTTHQVNVSTGMVETQVNNALYADFPLAVYSVDKVLLASQLFGAKPPAASPEKSPAKGKPTKDASAPTSKSSANATASEAPSNAASHPSAAAGQMAGAAVWCAVAAVAGFISIVRVL